jgi:hypothetical protein
MFDDPFGNFTEFCDSSSSCTQFLRFHDGTFDYDTFVSDGTAGTYSINRSSVPEPASILLLGGGLVGVVTLRKRYL